jgi:hypothetical protein
LEAKVKMGGYFRGVKGNFPLKISSCHKIDVKKRNKNKDKNVRL